MEHSPRRQRVLLDHTPRVRNVLLLNRKEVEIRLGANVLGRPNEALDRRHVARAVVPRDLLELWRAGSELEERDGAEGVPDEEGVVGAADEVEGDEGAAPRGCRSEGESGCVDREDLDLCRKRELRTREKEQSQHT